MKIGVSSVKWVLLAAFFIYFFISNYQLKSALTNTQKSLDSIRIIDKQQQEIDAAYAAEGKHLDSLLKSQQR